ncbi:hypothetical protein A9Q98_15760 [Thalassotalea sp. 42_200_T64]|nr:hypothetical protein A9Q98_15760 [Thalassotalea sp. 42_200_T64]
MDVVYYDDMDVGGRALSGTSAESYAWSNCRESRFDKNALIQMYVVRAMQELLPRSNFLF